MQIPNLISSLSKQLLCGSLCLFILAFLFVKLISLLTGYHIIGVLILLYGMYRLLRGVGTFALYPGCFAYVRSDYELRGSQRIGEGIVKAKQELFAVMQRCGANPEARHLYGCRYVEHVDAMIQMLARFDGTLSEDKKSMLRIYREMNRILKSQRDFQGITYSYQQLVSNPNTLRQKLHQKYGNPNNLRLLLTHLGTQLSPLLQQLNIKLHQFHPPHGNNLIKMTLYRLYSEKLFELRFAYMYWKEKFQYDVYLVESKEEDAVIECAVLAGPKGKPIQSPQSVIICCPNGAYLQYFAFQSQYIQMYFQLGYRVVLWNYRGYGQSTGSPTISNSIRDAQSVYNYCVRVLKLAPQIAHGYSIGGPPAAVLALTNAFRVVVIDRSFCNFVNIAEEISPVLAKLAKLVMKADSSVNISDVYLKIRGCRKILIWSAVDEVISNGSSLKLGIMNKLYRDNMRMQDGSELQPNSPTALISESQLHEREVFIQKGKNRESGGKTSTTKSRKSKNIYANWLQKMQQFFQTVSSLYQVQKMHQATLNPQLTTNSLAQQLPIDLQLRTLNQSLNQIPSQKRQLSKSLLAQFWRIVGFLDGGGTTMELLRGLAIGGLEKQEELALEVRSFVLGLVYFGCCYHQNGRLNVDNLDNWPETINQLLKVEQELGKFITASQDKGLEKLFIFFKEIQQIFRQIRTHIEKTNSNKDRALGIILPTDSGHNGEISNVQIQYLKLALTIDEKPPAVMLQKKPRSNEPQKDKQIFQMNLQEK